MSVQEKVVEFTMKEWIGDGRQLDDLMVIWHSAKRAKGIKKASFH